MKVLRIIPSVDPKGGGPIEGLKQSTAIMTAMGHHVETVSLDHPDSLFLKDFPFTVHALGPSYTSYVYCSKLIPWLRTHVGNYDAVIIHGIWQFHNFGAWLVLKYSKTPYFVFTHGMLDPWFKQTYPIKHLKKCLYWPWGQYPVLRDAKAVLFTCEEERLLARQSFGLYRCCEKVVGYGTSPSQGDGERQKALFFTQFPELREKRLLLFLSRIHEKKGCDLLIRAFAKVARKTPNLHLVMAGPDQTGWQKVLVALSKKLEINSCITWAGMLAGGLKWGAYHASEAFILPSHQENFGIVVAEALSCGLPVLISNKVNIWREIQQDNAGLVDEDTLEGTVRLLENWLVFDSKTCVTVRENAKNCFKNRFHIQRAAERLLEIIGGS